MKNYYTHLSTRQRFGEIIQKSQKPIFRSSAIFPVIQNENMSSKILLLGYWLIKRKIPEITLLTTLRDNKGKILQRNHLVIDCTKGFSIEIKDIMDSKIIDFQGSLELEVFSTRDMVFPYPAFVLCYYNDKSSTAVHTVGRIYNDIEDLKENEDRKVPEAGFDIYSNTNYDSFIAFTNGPMSNQNGLISYEVINHYSKKITGKFYLGEILPYETIFVKFNEHIKNLDKFLENKTGTMKIIHNFEGFFPRFLAGNIQKHVNAYSFTHTYYDCTTCNSEFDYWNRKNDNFHDSSILIPLFLKNNHYTDLVIYPNFSPSIFSFTIDLYDKNGNLIKKIPDYITIDSKKQIFLKIEFLKLLNENKINPDLVSSANIIVDWNGKQVPTRLKLGLNVGIKNKSICLPCNICFAPNLGNPMTENKPGTFHWAPILNFENSILSITNSGTSKKYERSANCELTFYREEDSKKIKRNIVLKPNQILQIELKNDLELQNFLNNKSGWMTMASDNPHVFGWYFEFHTSGSVAGDHFF